MIPATTPTYTISFDSSYPLSDTKKLVVDCEQGKVRIKKENEDIAISEDYLDLIFTLSQADTARLHQGILKIQVHGLFNDGETAWKTPVLTAVVEESISNEVLR